MHTGFRWRNQKERDHLEDPGIDGRIILRWIFSKLDVGVWTGSIWLSFKNSVVKPLHKMGEKLHFYLLTSISTDFIFKSH